MSKKLEEIFNYHQDKDISVNFGKEQIYEKVMTKEAFVKIVTKLVKRTSTGKSFKNIDDLHKYLEV